MLLDELAIKENISLKDKKPSGKFKKLARKTEKLQINRFIIEEDIFEDDCNYTPDICW